MNLSTILGSGEARVVEELACPQLARSTNIMRLLPIYDEGSSRTSSSEKETQVTTILRSTSITTIYNQFNYFDVLSEWHYIHTSRHLVLNLE